MSELWYAVVGPEAELTQGDLIFDCPLSGWKDERVEVRASEEARALMQAREIYETDVIVMSQACDLEQRKVSNVVVCPHIGLSEYRKQWEEEKRAEGQVPTPKAWASNCKRIKEGFVWNLAFLNPHESPPNIEHRIVDFHDVYTIPRSFLESLLKRRNQPRLRLLPPYREHLSQSFARFFMRVGLPTPVKEAW